jgi:hypothetical protein
MDPEPPADDSEQVILDGALLDEALPRPDLHLGRPPRHRGEDPAGRPREQGDALERDDPLDRRHRHAAGSLDPRSARSCAGPSGRSQPVA